VLQILQSIFNVTFGFGIGTNIYIHIYIELIDNVEDWLVIG
jgi:hypothetical protein